jgi:hypothetical protein
MDIGDPSLYYRYFDFAPEKAQASEPSLIGDGVLLHP